MYFLFLCIEMKKRQLKYVIGFLLVASIMGPQLYKTLHVFTDHHGHLNCEALRNDDAGLNSENDHCPICAFQFAVFDQPENQSLNFSVMSYPLVKIEPAEVFHTTQIVLTYLLRGPPQQFKQN
jgi:hypothetical protein